MVARGNIPKGECVAVIPRDSLLSASNSKIRELMASHSTILPESTSSWIPLLLALAAEYSAKVCRERGRGRGRRRGRYI